MNMVRQWRFRGHELNLSYEDYAALVFAFNNTCPICQKESEPNLDHNHITKQVRGLLCKPCNLGLGSLKVDSEGWFVLQRAIFYLVETENK